MSSIADARVLVETMREVAIYLTDEEIREIGKVLLVALDRMEKENKADE